MADFAQRKSKYLQVWFAIIANLSLLQTGMIIGYPAIMLPAIMKETNGTNTTHIAINIDQASWIASLSFVATVASCLACGPLTDWLGRVTAIKITYIPALIGWLLIALNPDLMRIYLGRFMTGISIGLSSIPAAIYIGEIATSKMRGPLLTAGPISVSIGIIIIYILGIIFQENFQIVAGLSSCLSVGAGILSHIFLPESPTWLLWKEHQDEAELSLMKIHGESDSSGIQNELDRLQTSMKKSSPLDWKAAIAYFIRPEAYKPLVISNTFFLFQQFTGSFIVIVYAVAFIEAAGITGHVYIVALGIAFIRLLSFLVSSWATKRFGCRKLAILSGLGMTVSMLALAFHLSIYEDDSAAVDNGQEISLFSLFFLFLYIFTNGIGFATLPWCMLGEIFPSNIKGVACGLTACIAYFFVFITTKLYPYTVEYFGRSQVLLSFAIFAILGTIFVYFCLPETHGKTLEEIEGYFSKKSPRRVVGNTAK